jgi:hypothetical protein
MAIITAYQSIPARTSFSYRMHSARAKTSDATAMGIIHTTPCKVISTARGSTPGSSSNTALLKNTISITAKLIREIRVLTTHFPTNISVLEIPKAMEFFKLPFFLSSANRRHTKIIPTKNSIVKRHTKLLKENAVVP